MKKRTMTLEPTPHGTYRVIQLRNSIWPAIGSEIKAKEAEQFANQNDWEVIIKIPRRL